MESAPKLEELTKGSYDDVNKHLPYTFKYFLSQKTQTQTQMWKITRNNFFRKRKKIIAKDIYTHQLNLVKASLDDVKTVNNLDSAC